MRLYGKVWVFALGVMWLWACGNDTGPMPGADGTGGSGPGSPDAAAGTATLTCEPGTASEPCEVFLLVNRERADAGLSPVTWSPALADAAQRHAEDMAALNYFDHQSKDGRDFATRARQAGYDGSPTGENIAKGQRNPTQVMQSWMNSTGHRNNILAARSTELGVGLAERHWVQVFGRR